MPQLIEMKLNFKEDPKELRKSARATALGLAFWVRCCAGESSCRSMAGSSCWSCWRLWRFVRWCSRAGSGAGIGCRYVLLFFIVVITPLGFTLWLAGKDTLQFKRPLEAKTIGHPANDGSPPDRFF